MRHLGPWGPATVTQSQLDDLGPPTEEQGGLVFNSGNQVWYYWTGTVWAPIFIAPGPDDFGQQSLALEVLLDMAEVDLDVDTFTLPLNGRWRFDAYSVVETNEPDTITVKLTDASLVELSRAKISTGDSVRMVRAVNLRRDIVVTSAPMTVKLRARSTVITSKVLTAANGGSNSYWQRIDF